MSKGLGKLQLAILDELRNRPGGDVVDDRAAGELELEAGVHDLRVIAKKFCIVEVDRIFDSGKFAYCCPTKKAAFSRAIRSLEKRGYIQIQTAVAISGYGYFRRSRLWQKARCLTGGSDNQRNLWAGNQRRFVKLLDKG